MAVLAQAGAAQGAGPVQALSAPTCGALEYGGDGQPDTLVASDLPMQGAAAERSRQMVLAIRLMLGQHGWAAGSRRVAFQACDDTLASTGAWDPATCTANANAYASNPHVMGVLGTYNSGCAKLIMPVLNQAPGGPVAMVSPGNTLVCLTQTSESCARSEPARYFPSGRRNYARVVPNDAYQGAGLAQFAQRRGLRRVYVLYARADPTSLGQARNFRGAARALRLRLAGYRTWDPKARGYRGLMRTVRRARPDAVVLAGLTEQNGGRLIRDKVAVLGPNSGIDLLAFDGFAQQSTIDAAGRASRGMLVTVPGRDPARLTGAGRTFVAQLRRRLGRKPVELYAPYAAEATSVLLSAIERGDGTRGGTVGALFKTRVAGGILGSYRLTPSGDPSASPVTVYAAARSFRPVGEVTPPVGLVDAARGR